MLAVIQYVNFENKLSKLIVYCFISFFLFYIAAFRESGVDRDYEVYVSAFKGDNISTTIFEPSFIFITFLVKNFLNSNVKYLFLIYAIFGVLLKTYAIKKITHFEFLSLLLYISYYFSLHELTQIRVGASCTFFLLSLPFLYHRNAKIFFPLITIAFLFHFSAIILFLLWFLNTNNINKSRWILLLFFSVLFGVFFKTFLSNVFDNYSLGFFEQKILSYNIENNTDYNVFNLWQILKLILLTIVLFKINLIYFYNKYIYLLVKIYLISIIFYYGFAFNPTLSGRINDLLGITEIIIFPNIIYIINPKFIARIVIVLLGFSLLYLNLYYNKIIT